MKRQTQAILLFAISRVNSTPDSVRFVLWAYAQNLFDKLTTRPNVYRDWK